MLGMPQYDESWHRQDLADELAEYREARGLIDAWSELSDVAYTYTRARWSGHTTIDFPLSNMQLAVGLLYMLPKYTLRWRFFRRLGRTFDPNMRISEVRNPEKITKLKEIAEKYHLDPVVFETRSRQLLKRTFLLR